MISVEEARRRILAAMRPTPPESVMLTDGAGRVLAAPVIARRSQPPSDVSAMDGYAVRHADLASLPATLAMVGESRAGARHDAPLGEGEAVRIFTGATVPEGADCVVIQENTERPDTASVRVLEAPEPGANIRRVGIDFREGTALIAAGTRLDARHIMVAASANAPWLSVHRRPRVALLATGDELVRPGEPVGRDRILQSITPGLAAFIAVRGGVASDLGIAADERGALQGLVAGAAGADLLVTVGGASVGDHDLVRSDLGAIGLELDFWKVAQRPGKPLIFGRLGAIPMLGLPGNPVSAYVCALLYLGPALDALAGATPRGPAKIAVRLAADLPANGPREAFLHARIVGEEDGPPLVRLSESQDSSVQSLLAKADLLLHRPASAPATMAGDLATAILPF